MTPDPKTGPRIVDPQAVRRKLLTDTLCRVPGCGRAATNGHHLIQKGAPHLGDDVEANVVPVCGTGTTGHHGAIHGSPFTDVTGRYWTTRETLAGIGERLTRDEVLYVLQKLGREPGLSSCPATTI